MRRNTASYSRAVDHPGSVSPSELAKRELGQMGLGDPSKVRMGFATRVHKAYPVYDEGYAERVEVLRAWLADVAPNLHPVGRNGMHRYNNQDHSMLTAMLAVENITTGATHDVWTVNVEEDYHETVSSDAAVYPSSRTGRDAPILPRREREDAAA